MKKKNLKREALKLIEKWKIRLNLEEWTIFLIFPEVDAPATGDGYGPPQATCVPCHVYLQAWVRLYSGWFEGTEEDRERWIVHELCHCITSEVKDAAFGLRDGKLFTPDQLKEIDERLTQRITYIAMRDKGRKN